MPFTTEEACIICILGSIVLIGAICFASSLMDLVRLRYESKLDVALPQRLERFSKTAYAEGVKDASRRNVEEEE